MSDNAEIVTAGQPRGDSDGTTSSDGYQKGSSVNEADLGHRAASTVGVRGVVGVEESLRRVGRPVRRSDNRDERGEDASQLASVSSGLGSYVDQLQSNNCRVLCGCCGVELCCREIEALCFQVSRDRDGARSFLSKRRSNPTPLLVLRV